MRSPEAYELQSRTRPRAVPEAELGGDDDDSSVIDPDQILLDWEQTQRGSLGLPKTIFWCLQQYAIFIVEGSLFLSIIVNGAWLTADYYDLETLATIGLWMLCIGVNTIVKFMHDHAMNKRETWCRKIFNALKNLLLPVKLWRYVRIIYYRGLKKRILGADFHGQLLSREQTKGLRNVLKEELNDALFELYETYIRSIPMALLQNYFLFQANTGLQLCNLRDVSRLLIVLFHLVSAARASATYDWRSLAYDAALKVEHYLCWGPRYATHVRNQDSWSHAINQAVHFFSILSRFYMINFFMRLHWGLGLVCTILLFMFNLFLVSWLPSVRNTVENLPVGISQPVQRTVDAWIHTFTAKDTRFHGLSRANKYLCQLRIPMVFTQIVTIGLPFVIIYLFIAFAGSASLRYQLDQSVITNGAFPNATALCSFENWPSGIGFIRDISRVLVELQLRFQKLSDVYSMLHVHWLFLYTYIVSALVHNYYIYQFKMQLDSYPAHLACAFIKFIFEKLEAIPHEGRKQAEVRRLLVLATVNLSKFDGIYYHYLDHYAKKSETERAHWWDAKIQRVVQMASLGSDEVAIAELDNPLCSVLFQSHVLLAHDVIGRKVICYAITNIDRVMSQEMTSFRLQRIFALFGFSSSHMLMIE